MKVDYTHRFKKDIQKIVNKKLKIKIESTIENCKAADTPEQIKNLKKLKGYDIFFRIEIGDFRIGISIEENLITIAAILSYTI